MCVYVCARTARSFREPRPKREEREIREKGKERSKARAWHHSISRCPFPRVILRADPPADPSCLSLPLRWLMKLILLLFMVCFLCFYFQMYRTVKSTDKPAASSGNPYCHPSSCDFSSFQQSYYFCS
jgi:hypothetical protein